MSPIFNDLNDRQADGHACIVCNTDYTTTGVYSVPVGISGSTGSQVFACEDLCAPAVGYRPPADDCAPDACVAPETGVHTSCPGPAAGATVVAIPAVGDAVEVHFPDHGGWHPAMVRELDDAGGRYLGAWVALTGGGSHWVSPDRIRTAGATVVAR